MEGMTPAADAILIGFVALALVFALAMAGVTAILQRRVGLKRKLRH